MSDWIYQLEGTEAGHQAALLLALSAALLHAIFGSLQKGKVDPWLSRGAIDTALAVMSAPMALFLVPWPEGSQWLLMVGAMVIHFAYKLGMALAYSKGAYTVVYPVVRGMGPFFTVIGAYFIFGEVFMRRSALIRAWRGFLADYPVVLMPVCAELPFRQDQDLEGDDMIAHLWEVQLPQIAIPLLGLPAISVSSGVVDGMPSGVQLVAAPWREDICLEAGELLERGFGFPGLVG